MLFKPSYGEIMVMLKVLFCNLESGTYIKVSAKFYFRIFQKLLAEVTKTEKVVAKICVASRILLKLQISCSST
jgi:hypothetical protein